MSGNGLAHEWPMSFPAIPVRRSPNPLSWTDAGSAPGTLGSETSVLRGLWGPTLKVAKLNELEY